MTEVLGVVIIRFWAVAGSSYLEIISCTVSLTMFWFKRVRSFSKKNCRKAHGLTLETSILESLTVASLPYRT